MPPELLSVPTLEAEAARRSLYDFIPWVTPAYSAPRHLSPLVDAIHRIDAGEPIRECFSAPPQHAKSDTVVHGIVWLLKRDPRRRIGYATYGASLSLDKSRKARDIARDAGLLLNRDVQAAEHWETAEGGGLWAAGLNGSFTGRGFDLLVCDDPFKDRKEAESAIFRERAFEFLRSTAETRMAPDGSIIVFLTRWHEDDVAGRMVKEWGSPFHRMPAISDDGLALWPQRYTLEELRRKEKRVGAYNWASMYQGLPRPRGAKVFSDLHFYDSLPTEFWREGGGLDLAYSKKTSADHSVALVGRAVGHGDDMVLYLRDVVRRQVRAKEFRTELELLRKRYPHTQGNWRWHTSTTEQGAAELMETETNLVQIEPVIATADKFIRAQPASIAWNDTPPRVLLPSSVDLDSPPWSDFVRVVLAFTGVNDAEDDDVDALSSLWDVLQASALEMNAELQDAPREGLSAYDV